MGPLYDIVMVNWGMWLNIIIPFGVAAVLWITHKEYDIKEFGVQSGITAAVLITAYFILFSTAADLYHSTFYNSKIKKIEYYEKWTELVHYTETYSCGTSKNPRTCTRHKTRHDYHRPYYLITTSIGERIYTSKSQYQYASSNFGSREVNLSRSGQVSYGDGDKYVVIPNKIIPVTTERSEVNYIKATPMSVLKAKELTSKFESLKKSKVLLNYPSIKQNNYGNIEFDRILVPSAVTITRQNQFLYNKHLSEYASVYGSSKQVNPMIYFVPAEYRGFKQSLKAYWRDGAKNDAILILGVSNGKVQWSDTIAFTKNVDFLVNCTSDFEGMDVNSPKDIVKIYTDNITRYFVRTPMAEFEYLTENISLGFWPQFIVFLINVILSGIAYWWFLNNAPFESHRDRYNRRWR